MLGSKTASVLDKVALSVQVNMKIDLPRSTPPTRAAAEVAIDVFATNTTPSTTRRSPV